MWKSWITFLWTGPKTSKSKKASKTCNRLQFLKKANIKKMETTIHNEHCVNVLSCLIGIQVPIQLTALARYSATQLRMYTPS